MIRLPAASEKIPRCEKINWRRFTFAKKWIVFKNVWETIEKKNKQSERMKIAGLMRSHRLEVSRRENVWILTIECVRERWFTTFALFFVCARSVRRAHAVELSRWGIRRVHSICMILGTWGTSYCQFLNNKLLRDNSQKAWMFLVTKKFREKLSLEKLFLSNGHWLGFVSASVNDPSSPINAQTFRLSVSAPDALHKHKDEAYNRHHANHHQALRWRVGFW